MVEINYDLGTISLVTQKENNKKGPKEWVFAGRTEEYMQGWQNILDAMKFAIAEATKKLSKHNVARMRKLEEKERGFVKILKEEGKKKK